MGEFGVRRATADDARGIAEVHVRGWQEAYAHLIPAEALAALDAERRGERWREIIADGASTVWVALDGARVIGWMSTFPTEEGDAPREIELAIYVLASHYGTGAGQALMDAALEGGPAFLWVAAENPRAIRFYEKNGFAADGVTSDYPMLGTPVRAIRMVR